MSARYVPRIVEGELDELLGIFGAVLIEGPKWCGKTTTAGTRAASKLLLTDPARNFENRLRAESDPALAISGKTPRLIDEWQGGPKLWGGARVGVRRDDWGPSAKTGAGSPASSYSPARRRRETRSGPCTAGPGASRRCAWTP